MDPRARDLHRELSDDDSAFTPYRFQGTPRNTALKTSSRALIKECFAETDPFFFPKGHPVIAFTEDQVSTVLKVVAKEAARSTQTMLEEIVKQASKLKLGLEGNRSSPLTTTGTGKSKRGNAGSVQNSDTSGALRSDDELSSIGYSFEGPEHQEVAAPPVATIRPSCSYTDPTSFQSSFIADSPGEQTLASLKAEAIEDRSKLSRNKRGRFSQVSTTRGTRREVTRSCKIMKEAYFKGMEWTRTFVSGPVDPKWNCYKFYCQICKANISIYGKRAREILRHHSTEKHLRKDQRWRHGYIYKTDSVTKTGIHQVRGKDSKVLTPYQLELELPEFIDAELVEIGPKLPFYDEYLSGMDYMASSSDNRARVQLSVLGRFLPTYGNIEVLKRFWSDVGVIVNHQALFTDFDWSKERLTVSIL